MATFKEQIQKLEGLQHRLVTWEAIHSWLDENFIAKDGRPAVKALKAVDENGKKLCYQELVPEETLEGVLREIGDGPIKDLRAQIAAIENEEAGGRS